MYSGSEFCARGAISSLREHVCRLLSDSSCQSQTTNGTACTLLRPRDRAFLTTCMCFTNLLIVITLFSTLQLQA